MEDIYGSHPRGSECLKTGGSSSPGKHVPVNPIVSIAPSVAAENQQLGGYKGGRRPGLTPLPKFTNMRPLPPEAALYPTSQGQEIHKPVWTA